MYVGFWLPEPLRDAITAKARKCAMSRSDWIRNALRAALDYETNVPPSGAYNPMGGVEPEARP